ncbi:MAG: ATP-binding cassette domain-containing protein [Sphingomicrobium sp.]
MADALTTRNLTKSFGDRVAVDHVSLIVPQGAIYGFLGANGAGKTTTLRLALGLLRADSGRIEIFGNSIGRSTAPRIGALIEQPSLYPHLTGEDNLDLTRRLLGLASDEIMRVLRVVDLVNAAKQRVGTYSLGMRQRLAIARALLGRPKLIILDEPTNGLDPEGIADMRVLLRRLRDMDDATLIISSHQLGELEQVATHVGLVHRGRLLLQQPIESLIGAQPQLEVGTNDLAASAQILGRAGFAIIREPGSRTLLVDQAAAPAVAALLVEQGQQLLHLALRRATLEQAYHRAIANAA